jgi:hypothetical protein
MDMLCKAIHLGAEISFAYYCNEVGLSDGDGSRPGAEAGRAGRPGHPPPTRCADLQRSTTASWRRSQAVRGTHCVPK